MAVCGRNWRGRCSVVGCGGSSCGARRCARFGPNSACAAWCRRRCGAASVVGALVLTVGSQSPASAGATPLSCVDGQPDAVAASATDAKCGRRVEVLAMRGEAAQTFANPDSSNALELSAAPRWVRRADGSWAAVDTSLRGPRWLVGADGTTLPVRFSGGGSGPLVSVDTPAGVWSMSWPTQHQTRKPGQPRDPEPGSTGRP